jgi:hypothetical protein
MLTFDELKNRRDILESVDWNLTPQEAFQAYQIKSIDAWKYRSLPDVYYFHISVWQNEAKVVLVKRTIKDSEEIAVLPVPDDLVTASLPHQAGKPIPHGQYPMDQGIQAWLKKALNL